jgi:hypothetical protein
MLNQKISSIIINGLVKKGYSKKEIAILLNSPIFLIDEILNQKNTLTENQLKDIFKNINFSPLEFLVDIMPIDQLFETIKKYLIKIEKNNK